MRVAEVPLGTVGIDTASRLTPVTLAAIKAEAPSVKFVIRYLPELTSDEIQDIHAAGLGLMLVAHVRYAGWQPTMALGASDAERVCRRARDLNIPPGATVWCDLEGMAGDEDAAVAYENAWCTMAKTWHYEPGDYIGAGVPVSPASLYRRFNTSRYWQSESDVASPSPRGYQMIQLTPSPEDLAAGGSLLAGIRVDYNITHFDHKGGVPTWILPA